MVSLGSPPEGVDLGDDKRAVFIAVSVATWILALVTLTFRVVGRKINGLYAWLDDWFIIAAQVTALGHIIGIVGYGVSHGVGLHVWAAKPDARYAWALGLFIAEICYTLTLWLTKLSILAFYWRTFSVWESIKWPIWLLVGVMSTWGIASLLSMILQCRPTRAIWDRFDPVNPLSASDYHCRINQEQFFFGIAITTIITDIFLMLIPLPFVWRLHLPARGKVALSGIFLLGIIVTGVSVIRLVLLLQLDPVDPDVTWNAIPVGILSIVEGNICIICACLPFAKPVFKKISFGLRALTPLLRSSQQKENDTRQEGGRSQFSGTWGLENHGISHTRVRSTNKTAETDEHPFARLADSGSDHSLGPGKKSRSIKLNDLGNEYRVPRGIVVTRRIDIQHEAV